MGEHVVKKWLGENARITFNKYLLNDIKALEQMLKDELFEDDIIRIGAEQEFCLVNGDLQPSNKATELLKNIEHDQFTTELALYNLEINLNPYELGGRCFTSIHTELKNLLELASQKAALHDTKMVLVGILPTLAKRHLVSEFMTPSPRYEALNSTLRKFRGSDFSLHLKGVDELSVQHENVLFEACNTSFQLHLQVPSHDFAKSYNWSQAIAGPVLAACCNSPLLLGRELWHETRIALFQQSLDTRRATYALKNEQPRVAFGNGWATDSVAAIFKETITTHKLTFSRPDLTNSLEELELGNIPKLRALCLHNGTVYSWNRPCYGVGGGKPHLRIENRYLPSGPSTLDEMANFVFWVGLMSGRPPEYDAISEQMDFREAKANFIKAARTGAESVLRWNNKWYTSKELIGKELLPMAKAGLDKMGVDDTDSDHFLSIIEARLENGTGAQWQIRNFRKVADRTSAHNALLQLTKAMHENQKTGLPVHQWPDISAPHSYRPKLVDHIMATNLFTVHQEDSAELAINIMQWKNIHHLPVVDDTGALQGLLTWSHIAEYLKVPSETCEVKDIMVQKVITIAPEQPLAQAQKLMSENEIGCLPVVSANELVGMLSLRDFEKL